MANFKNISEESLTVPRATGPITVNPGEVFIGSKVLLAPLVASGHLEPVESDPAPAPVPEPEAKPGRKRAGSGGKGVGDIDHIDE